MSKQTKKLKKPIKRKQKIMSLSKGKHTTTELDQINKILKLKGRTTVNWRIKTDYNI